MFVKKVGTFFLKVVMGNKLDTIIFTSNNYDDQHQCQAMMERESRTQIDLSISSSIGGFFNFFLPLIISKILCFFTFFFRQEISLEKLQNISVFTLPTRL
jgi:hypothetical protein